MLSLLAAVAIILLVATVLGSALWRAIGDAEASVAVVPLGFGALLVLAGLAVKLPGAPVIVAVVTVAAGFYAGRALLPAWGALTAVAVTALAVIPFAAAGRVGLLGAGVNDDMTEHLLAAWALQGHAPASADKLLNSGYPVGPHAIAAVLASATGISLEHAFTALLVTVPVFVALGAAALIPGPSRLWRGAGGALCGLCYLQAAYLAQASFKEPIESALLLGSVAVVPGLRGRGRMRYLGLAVLLAATVYVNSYLGLLWPVGALGLWLAARTLARRTSLRAWRPEAGALAIGALAFAVLTAPEIPRMVRFAHSGYNREGARVFGNLLRRMPPLEATGIWPRLDFRFPVPLGSPGGVLALLALPALVLALAGALRRRALAVPAALAAAGVVVVVTAARSPYTEAKALAIGAPLVTLLLVAEASAWWRRGRLGMLAGVGFAVVLVAGAYSSLQALRDAPVQPGFHGVQLARVRSLIGSQPTLFLGADNYVRWELRGADLYTPPQPLYADNVVPLRRAKAQPAPGNYSSPAAITTTSRFAGLGLAFDFDSVPVAWLNRFRYVILPRSAYVSPAPAGWRRVAVTASYELWRRVGITPPYRLLGAIDNPGARLDCTTPLGRRIAALPAVALTQPAPVIGDKQAWRGRVGYAGQTAHQLVHLAAGTWNLSLQYDAANGVTVRAADLQVALPPVLEPLGPYWYVGRVHLARPAWVRIAVTWRRVTAVAGALRAIGLTRAPAPTGIRPIGRIVASRPASQDRTMPLGQACGRYVDRFTPRASLLAQGGRSSAIGPANRLSG